MHKIQIVLIFVVCLFFVTSTVSAQKTKNTMTNDDVVEMVKAGLSESTIIPAIQQSKPKFDTSPKALIELSKQSVSQIGFAGGKVFDFSVTNKNYKGENK